MSEKAKTVKLEGYQSTAFPEDQPNDDLAFHNKLLTEIIFGLWNQKKQKLAERGWPPQPIHQKEIFREYKRRVEMYKDMDKQLKLKGHDKYWPSYANVHEHNWIERRINYLCTEKYGPKTKEGILKIVNATAGYYVVNPKLFEVC